MRLLKNTSIKTRLYIGFTTCIASLAIIGVLSISRMNILSNQTQLLFDHPLTVSSSERERILREVDFLERQILSHFTVIEKNFLGGKFIYRRARQLFHNWRPIRFNVIQLMKANKRSAASKITRFQGAQHLEKIEEAMVVLDDFATGLALILSKSIISPIERVRKGVIKLGEGDLDYKIKIDSLDEVGQLAATFNKMTRDLKKITLRSLG